MRDKYLLLPNDGVAASHHAKRDEVAALFGLNKRTRKERSNAASTKLDSDLQAAALVVGDDAKREAIHRALHTYEKAHLQGGGNWPQLKAALLLRYRGSLRIVDNPGSADLMMLAAGREECIGTVYFDEGRFVQLAPQPLLVTNAVYRRRTDTNNPARHYIALTTSNTHVKRFVTRGLSAFDAMRMSRGLGLISVLANPAAQASELGGFRHAVLAGVPLTDEQQILSHVRGWGGNKRFISTGVSNRAALSTRGVAFTSMYGVVKVDLAMVPVGDIFDIHRHDLAQARLGVQAAHILTNPHHTGTNDIGEQQYLGLRDAIRTRELLIRGGIPSAALKRVSAGRVLLGIGSNPHPNRLHENVAGFIAALPAGVQATIVAQDHLTFTDPGTNRKWHLIEFNTAPAAAAADTALQLALHGPIGLGHYNLVLFEKWTQLRPAGMV